MPMLDASFNFADQQSLAAFSGGVVSSYVYDAGAAVKLFEGDQKAIVDVLLTAAGGTTPQVRAELRGADDAALTSNPIILAAATSLASIAAADLPVRLSMKPSGQRTAKRYYGLWFVATGNADNTATANGQVALEHQSNLIR